MQHTVDAVQKDNAMKEAQGEWSRQASHEMRGSASGMRTQGHQGPQDVRDHWEHCVGKSRNDEMWTRHHTKGRCALFTPCGTKGGPRNPGQLIGTRITIGRYIDGEDFFHVDDWKDGDVAHKKLRAMWTGTTYFHEGGSHGR